MTAPHPRHRRNHPAFSTLDAPRVRERSRAGDLFGYAFAALVVVILMTAAYGFALWMAAKVVRDIGLVPDLVLSYPHACLLAIAWEVFLTVLLVHVRSTRG